MRIAIHCSASSIAQGGGATHAVALASALQRRHDVDLFFRSSIDTDQIAAFLPAAPYGFRVRTELSASPTWLLSEASKALFDLSYDIVVLQSTHVPRTVFNRRAYLLCEFPFQRRIPLDDRFRLRRFDRILAISKYTAGWIERLWGRGADVLYPAIRAVAPGAKRPYILAVGRFTAGGRPKRQLEMVHLFQRICQRGLAGWELHLAGFVEDADYVTQVRSAADGLPVYLHPDADRATLNELYAVSSIFWHATGAGVDPDAEPGRLEHFGIVTAEAMSAGCVPVVFDGGGQREIVSHESSGLLWRTFEECLDATRRVADDDNWRHRLAAHGIDRARAFSWPVFLDRVDEIFGRS